MKINTKIPGWNGEQILKVLAEYSSAVPENGHILELGALFGRSTYAIGHNKKESVSLTSIDIWPTIAFENHTEVWFHDNNTGAEELITLQRRIRVEPNGKKYLPGASFYALWVEYTKGIPNLTGIHDNTSIENSHMPMYDFIFHDAAHDYEGVYADLVHWFPKLKQDSVMIIDDYESQFPGVIQAVDQYVSENNLVTEMVTGRNILLRRA